MPARSEEARERKRERDRERIAARRAAERAEERPDPSADEARRSPANGRVLGIFGLGLPGEPLAFNALYQRGERQTPTYSDFISTPRERPYAGVRVLVTTAEGETVESFGLRPLADGPDAPLDKADISHRADALAVATGLPRNDVLEAIYGTPDGATCVFVLPAPGDGPGQPPTPQESAPSSSAKSRTAEPGPTSSTAFPEPEHPEDLFSLTDYVLPE